MDSIYRVGFAGFKNLLSYGFSALHVICDILRVFLKTEHAHQEQNICFLNFSHIFASKYHLSCKKSPISKRF